MDPVTLLRKAREAGLVIQPDGDRLLVRGPRRAEPIVMLLKEHKPAVMAALQRLCPDCLTESWAWTHDGRRVCRRCLNLPPHFGEACRPRPIPEAVAAEVRRIEAEALALGWTRKELWQNAGWFNVRGLAGIMQDGATVKEVAAEAITLRLKDGHLLRFFRRRRLN